MRAPVKVLYLEDDVLERQALFCLLRDRALPWEVTVPTTLPEARALLLASRFDIIIATGGPLDCHCTELLNEVSETPLILLTDAPEEQTVGPPGPGTWSR